MSEVVLNKNDDEIDLKDLFVFFISSKVKVLIVALLMTGLFTTYSGYKFLTNGEIEYSQIVYFNFPGAEQSQLPNGDSFRLNDIVAQSVLAEVHTNLNLEKVIGLPDLSRSLSITPFSDSRDHIIAKYRVVIDSKDADSVAKAEAQRLMEEELNSSLKRAAIINLSLTSFIEEGVAHRILAEVPSVWASQAIELKGAVNSKLDIVSSKVINIAGEDVKNNISNYQQSWHNLNLVKKQVEDAIGANMINQVRDESTAYNLRDLSQVLSSIEHKLVKSPIYWNELSRASRKLNVGLYSPALFQPSVVENLDYLVAIDLVKQRLDLITDNVDVLLKHPYAHMAIDSELGLSLEDITRLVNDLRHFELQNIQAPLLQLGISKQPERVEMYYEFRINELKRDLGEINSLITSLEEAEIRYLNGSSQNGTLTTSSAQSSMTAGATMIPQFGEAFIDKLIALSQKGDDVGFRQRLNNESISLSKKAVSINSDIQRLEEYLAIFSGSKETSFGNGSEDYKDILEKETSMKILDTLSEAESYAEATENIAKQLKFADQIFEIVGGSEYKPEGADYYLTRLEEQNAYDLSEINKDLSKTVGYISNILEKSSQQYIGIEGELFSYAGGPNKKEYSFLNKRFYLGFVLILVMSVFIGLLWHMVSRLVRPVS